VNPIRRVAWILFAIVGIQPVAVEDRTDTRFIKLFFLWFSANISIVTCVVQYPPRLQSNLRIGLTRCFSLLLLLLLLTRFSTGTLGPTTFGLDLGESCLAILFINLIFAHPPAYL
jgi:purine-cytosine permease-like protein